VAVQVIDMQGLRMRSVYACLRTRKEDCVLCVAVQEMDAQGWRIKPVHANLCNDPQRRWTAVCGCMGSGKGQCTRYTCMSALRRSLPVHAGSRNGPGLACSAVKSRPQHTDWAEPIAPMPCQLMCTHAPPSPRIGGTHVAVPWYMSDTWVSASSMRTARPATTWGGWHLTP